VDGLWATNSEGVGLIVRAIGFPDCQPMWPWSTNVTDGRTTWNLNTALCTKVHRAVQRYISRRSIHTATQHLSRAYMALIHRIARSW